MENTIGLDILNWSLSNETYLNIIAPPYSSVKILLELIKHYVEKRKRILYVTDENFDDVEIVEILKLQAIKKYTHVRAGSNYEDSLIVICNFQNMVEIKGEFELVIIDDFKAYPRYNAVGIIDLICQNFFEEAKYIGLSTESIFEGFKEIIIPIRENIIPIVEPRFLTTRIDLTKEIPYVAYEYIKWSAKEGQNVVIYVPEAELVSYMFNYLSKFKDEAKIHIMFDLNGKVQVKVAHNFLTNKGAVLVTNDFAKNYNTTRDSNIIIVSTDNKVFNYKNLVYFCGKVGKGDGVKRAEVIFLANNITEDMEKAKDITRGFNKEAWERNLFQY